MASSSHPEEQSLGPWYTTMRSRFEQRDFDILADNFEIPEDIEVRLAGPAARPHRPPRGGFCVFRDQFTAGLRFPVHPFIADVCNYFGVPLGSLVPNTFRLLCGVVVLFKIHNIPLRPEVFFYFYYPKQAEPGTFMFQARPGLVFFNKLPTSNKHWKDYYFYLRMPTQPNFPTQWQVRLPPPPELKKFKTRPDYLHAANVLAGLRLDINKLLHEGVMYIFGLSPIRTPLPTGFGKNFALALALIAN